MLKLNAKPEDVATVNTVISEFVKMFPGRPCYIDTALNMIDMAPVVFFDDTSWEELEQFSKQSSVSGLTDESTAFVAVGATLMLERASSRFVDVRGGVF